MNPAIAGKRFTVMGLGILGGGVGVARYLASHGGIVTVTDMRPSDQLQSSIDQLSDFDVTYHLGGHEDADFTSEGADVVVRNPGVRRWSPYLKMARASGVRIEMEMSLFFAACTAPILGITGTKGKTTVATLCGEIMRVWRQDSLLAGNMGVTALGVVDSIQPDQPVVIELSSWQLEALDEHHMGPHVAVITNISPDHLDAYDGYEDYAATKRTIGHHLEATDFMVYNADDADTAKVATETHAVLLPFGLTEPDGDGAWSDYDGLHLRFRGQTHALPTPAQLSLSGEHGVRNALAAAIACLAYGAPIESIRQGLATFTGVANRLEEISVVDDVLYVNDTSATAPAAAVHALSVLSPRAKTLHIIAGGADKQTDLSPFAAAIKKTANLMTYLIDGSATPTLQSMLDASGVSYLLDDQSPFQSMQSVFDAVQAQVEPGDIVALVPGCASFGLFRNEFDRGEQFRTAVANLQETPRD